MVAPLHTKLPIGQHQGQLYPQETVCSSRPFALGLAACGTDVTPDTGNPAPADQVFAPANSAFEAVPAKDLKALLADKPALTKVLAHHVVVGKLSPERLDGEAQDACR